MLDEVLTATVVIQEVYLEMNSVVWNKHKTLFTTSLILAQYAGVDRSACLSLSRNDIV